MKKEIKLLASSPTLEDIKKLIAKYWYNKTEKIILTPIDESHWSISQIGDKGIHEMKDNFVELKKGRYRFLYSPDIKSNPVHVKKYRHYGLKDAAKLNLAQALAVRETGYYTDRHGQHDYDPESVDKRIWELQQSKGRKDIEEFERMMDEAEAHREIFPIKIRWNFVKSKKASGNYAFLELPDSPFYNVKMYFIKKKFVVVSSDGTNEVDRSEFKNLESAKKYAEDMFLKLASNDNDYKVSVKRNPKHKR